MVGVNTALFDALDDWVAAIQNANSAAEARRAIWPGDDRARADVLQHLHARRCVSFRGWSTEEVLIFVLRTYRAAELVDLCAANAHSTFFAALYTQWNPCLSDWLLLLWRFCGTSCLQFARIVALDVNIARLHPARLGEALFRDLPEELGEGALQTVLGTLVMYPNEDSLARFHEADIHELTLGMTSAEIGRVYQRLLLYRARPKHCRCGTQRGQRGCTCTLRLDYDVQKEFACALLRLVLERHGKGSQEVWTVEEGVEFLRAACDVVFSDGVYRELYQNLGLDKDKMTMKAPPLRNPRELNAEEQQNNYNRIVDDDYHSGVAQHGGCVAKNCKQAFKADCVNMCCKQHCANMGLLKCMVHHQRGQALPDSGLPEDWVPLRKRVKRPPVERQGGVKRRNGVVR